MSGNSSAADDEQDAVWQDVKAIRLDMVIKYSLILIAVVALFWGAYHARPFLLPLAFAAILAMMLVPVSNKLEGWGLSRLASSLTSALVIVILVVSVVFLLSAQASNFASDFSTIQQQATKKYQTLRRTVQQQWGVSLPSLPKLLDSMTQSSDAADVASSNQPPAAPYQGSSRGTPFGASERGGSAISGVWIASVARPFAQFIFSLLVICGDALLVLVYIFALLYYRGKFRAFLLRITPTQEHDKVNRILDDASRMTRRYLWGRLLLIFILSLLYGIGFAVVGLKHALFLATTAAILSLVPYLGPLLGLVFPGLVALSSEHSLPLVFGVLMVFAVAQFVESYLLEPVIVGSEVNVNPFFTIVAIVGGGVLWGVSGMILGIPVLAITHIVFDNVESLQAYGFLLGEQQETSGSAKVVDMIKHLFQAN